MNEIIQLMDDLIFPLGSYTGYPLIDGKFYLDENAETSIDITFKYDLNLNCEIWLWSMFNNEPFRSCKKLKINFHNSDSIEQIKQFLNQWTKNQ